MGRSIKHSPTEKLVQESVPGTFIRVLSSPYLRTTGLLCIASILKNFFFKQHRAAMFPGRIPVTDVDHHLDEKIPFLPAKINIYLDFVGFWIRTIGFLLRKCRLKAYEPVRDFIESMGKLYAFAAEVYGKNFSTTKRPFYIASPRFMLIHLVDPHLMCIPSLHVMIVVFTYTRFRKIIKALGEETRFAPHADELYRGALAITEAVLYVKQHSVNCIPTALYAMTCRDPELFQPHEAENFAKGLFLDAKNPAGKDREEIIERIITLYRRFLTERETAQDWKAPLLNFLKNPE